VHINVYLFLKCLLSKWIFSR